jgi:acetyltransferase-like isoleucine patch superfamily enzyme
MKKNITMNNPAMINLHLLIAGKKIPGDWFNGSIPSNICAGENTLIESSFSFKHFFSKVENALRVGSHVTLWRTSLATEPGGQIEIGNYCYFANSSIVCSEKITIGSRVFIAGGVTIVDSDFHPLNPAARLADTIALSPVGNQKLRPRITAKPVIIEDDVWIGYNATILKGVRIGAGAVVSPGAVVSEDVAAGDTVAGNPAKPINMAA